MTPRRKPTQHTSLQNALHDRAVRESWEIGRVTAVVSYLEANNERTAEQIAKALRLKSPRTIAEAIRKARTLGYEIQPVGNVNPCYRLVTKQMRIDEIKREIERLQKKLEMMEAE